MKTLNRILYMVLLALLLVSCDPEKMKQDNETIEKERIYPVKTELITKEAIQRTLDYSADLKAFKEIYYAPASPGRINKIYVDVGSRVYKGKLLVSMDGTQLNQAKTQYENAKVNFNRIDTLFQLGSISEQQYDQAKAQYDLAKSNYDFLRQNTSLVSPINGIVTGKYFESGEVYSGAPNTTAGKAAIVTLMQINPLKAVVSITQSYFRNITEGMEVIVTADIVPEKVFKGTISKIYPVIDPMTRTFKCEILIKNPDEILRPGMFANIEIETGEAEVIVVPSVAVLKQEGTNKRYIFVRNKDRAKRIDVEIGKRFDDKVELISDQIEEGLELIIEGQANLIDGSKIKVVSENNTQTENKGE